MIMERKNAWKEYDKKEIKDFSRTNPDVVAQLIRSMMKNGE